jgi:hypothetical protein
MPKLGQYLVTVRKSTKGADQKDLLETFKKQLAQNPDVELKSAQGERIVIRATDQAISLLRSQHGDRLIIEPDAELDLYTE